MLRVYKDVMRRQALVLEIGLEAIDRAAFLTKKEAKAAVTQACK